ncbi:hypothetical protein PoB_001250700 [Plakobranchus ocellatus]|uniref:Uncharacterized protein n=1 Tax=Plakobranchus ocellatus TaxID=259542 RepID=A0AAV3YV32_9GAST|nr:hypothetical protein PoB_001250700 [Plakobranchus ocellatus]
MMRRRRKTFRVRTRRKRRKKEWKEEQDEYNRSEELPLHFLFLDLLVGKVIRYLPSKLKGSVRMGSNPPQEPDVDKGRKSKRPPYSERVVKRKKLS